MTAAMLGCPTQLVAIDFATPTRMLLQESTMSVTVNPVIHRRRSRADRLTAALGRMLIRWGAALRARSTVTSAQHNQRMAREGVLIAHERRVDAMRGPGVRA